MKLLSGVLLTIFVSLVHGGEDSCIGDGVLNCFDILKINVSPAEECGIVKSSVDCLRGVMEECLCDEREKELEAALKKLEKLSKKLCPTQKEALSAESLIYNIDDEVTKEQRRKCIDKLSSRFSTTEERCREIGKALNCLEDNEMKILHDDDYVSMITELRNSYVRSCEKKEYKGCPELLTEEYGVLHSPGIPRSETGIVDCWTRIQVNESKGLVVFHDWLGIDTAEMMHESAPFDDTCTSSSEYVELRLGDESVKEFIDEYNRFSCHDLVHIYSHPSLLVHFHSDDPVNDIGYNVIYAAKSKRVSPTIWGMVDEIKGKYPECVKENADSIFECLKIDTATFQALTVIEDMGHDVWFGRCGGYRTMTVCFVRRTKERCNGTEVNWAIETMSDLLKRDPDSQKCLRRNQILQEVLNLKYY